MPENFEALFVQSFYQWLRQQKESVETFTTIEREQTARFAYMRKYIMFKKEIMVEVYANASGFGWVITKTNGTTLAEIEDDEFYEHYETALVAGIVLVSKTFFHMDCTQPASILVDMYRRKMKMMIK